MYIKKKRIAKFFKRSYRMDFLELYGSVLLWTNIGHKFSVCYEVNQI